MNYMIVFIMSYMFIIMWNDYLKILVLYKKIIVYSPSKGKYKITSFRKILFFFSRPLLALAKQYPVLALVFSLIV